MATLLPAGRANAALSFRQAQLGNIFDDGEAVTLTAAEAAGPVAWTVTDAFGHTVAHGVQAPVAGVATIRLPDLGRGYFSVSAALERTGVPAATAATSYAVLARPQAASGRSPFGVMTHFAQGWDTDIVPLIARAGIRNVRDEQYWEAVERQPLRFAFPDSFTRYMADLDAAGLIPLLEATFANPLYDGGLTPHSDAGRAAYGRYVGKLVERYRDRIEAVEIWNEYNGTWCSGPCDADRPGYYARMLERAYAEAKRAAPAIPVIGGAAVLVPLPYFEGIFRAGGLASMDAVAIHPYRAVPEGVEQDIDALRRLMQQYNHGVAKPIWATEIGAGAGQADRTETARYLVRMVTLLRSANIDHIYWYLLRDYDSFVGMGLFRTPTDGSGRYVPAPAYVAYANLIRQLDGRAGAGRLASDPRTRIYRFDGQGQSVHVVWSTSGTGELQLAATTPLRLVDMMGGERTTAPARGHVAITATRDPLFVVGDVQGIADRRPDRLLADSALDYGLAQGERNWSYGRAFAASGPSLPAPGAHLRPVFEPLQHQRDAWSEFWGADGFPALRVDAAVAHPSEQGGRDVWAVRRWTSPTAGRMRVTGTVTTPDPNSAGTGFLVLRDDVVVLAEAVGGPSAPKSVKLNLSIDVQAGSRLDFVVTPGPAGGINFDATTVGIEITAPAP